MGDINYDYTPVDGDVFTANGLNQNLYALPSPYATTSIHEAGNGRLLHENFASGFEVQPHHVRPGQAGEAISEGRVLSNDYFSDLWVGRDETQYVPIAGCAVSWYQKYDVSIAAFFASAFVSVWRQFGPTNGSFGAHLAAPPIRVQAFFGTPSGNDMVAHTIRDLPQTVFFDSASTGPVAEIATRESRATRHFNLSVPRMLGGTGDYAQLTKGWRTFGLAVFIPQNLFGQSALIANDAMQLALNGASSADGRPKGFFSAIHRVRIYVRSVHAIRLL